MAFSGKILEFSYQNVFFTLFIGLLTIMLIAKAERQQTLSPVLRSLCFVGIMFGGMGCATLLRTDYSYYGVMCIVVLYLFRQPAGTGVGRMRLLLLVGTSGSGGIYSCLFL